MTSARALVGRDAELAALTGLIERCPARGQAMVMTGEPGIGKSSLLAVAGDAARAAGFRVLTATGVESEAQLPFGGLHQLLRPVLRQSARLGPLPREALRSALGLSDRPQAEFFLIALAAEQLLATVAADQPVLVLADDVQWLDPQTQDVLTFLARRVAVRPIGIIGAIRPAFASPYASAGLDTLTVRGVDDDAAGQILRVHAEDLSQADRMRIMREARGNPLALLELPAAWTGPAPGPTDWQLPKLSERLERAFACRLASLPALTRDAVLVAAVDPVTDMAEVLAASTELTGLPAGGSG